MQTGTGTGWSNVYARTRTRDRVLQKNRALRERVRTTIHDDGVIAQSRCRKLGGNRFTLRKLVSYCAAFHGKRNVQTEITAVYRQYKRARLACRLHPSVQCRW